MAVRESGEAAAYGRAGHWILECKAKGSKEATVQAVKLRYGLSEEAAQSVFRQCKTVELPYEGWRVYTERKLAVDKDMKPVDPESDQALLTGHIDLSAFREDACDCVDYKFTRKAGQYEAQLLGYACLLAAHEPATMRFRSLLLYVFNKDVEECEWTRHQIAEAWPHVRDLCLAVKGGRTEYVRGAHCRFCAWEHCEAWTGWFQRALHGESLNIPAGAMTISALREHLSEVIPQVQVAKAAIERIEQLARMAAPIPLDGGKVFENRPVDVRTVNIAAALPVLKEKYGVEAQDILLQDECVQRDKVILAAKDKDPSVTGGRVMASLEEAGAIVAREQERYGIYKQERN